MNRATLKHIEDLAEKNTALLEAMNFNPYHDSPNDLINEESYSASGLFTPEGINCIFGNTELELDEINPVIDPNTSMILVRPEMEHAIGDFRNFLSDRFRIIHDTEVTVQPQQYWNLYADAIVRRETDFSRLTRAAVFIGSPSRVITFVDPARGESDIPLADMIYKDLKGVQGVATAGTLRGEVVYENVIMAGFQRILRDDCDETLKRAIDPFGAYRQAIVSGAVRRQDLVYPILQFVGVGVHVPNYSEVQRDISTLLTKSDLDAIKYSADVNSIRSGV